MVNEEAMRAIDSVLSMPGGREFRITMGAVLTLAMLPDSHYSAHDLTCVSCGEKVGELAGLHVSPLEQDGGDIVYIIPDETLLFVVASHVMHVTQNETCWQAAMEAAEALLD